MFVNKEQTLNSTCLCKTLQRSELGKESPELVDLFQGLENSHPTLFSPVTVFVSKDEITFMKALIRGIEEVIASKNYLRKVLQFAPDIARINYGPKGVFHGYDFHLTEKGPQLIEINTNAGGGLLNLELAKAQRKCCAEIEFGINNEQNFFEMFLNEWKLQRGEKDLRTIFIVDDRPHEQYLYPEFRLFKNLFESHGLEAYIADPTEFNFRDEKLFYRDKVKVDLIYNRLTDFYLEESGHVTIRTAYEDNKIVLTPNPFHHALFANKTNLTLLSDAQALTDLGVSEENRSLFTQGIPTTTFVTSESAEKLWSSRKNLFFKPVAGYGSKGTYRGDKLTKKTWSEILEAEYVAQQIAAPGQRNVLVDGKLSLMKVDIRMYVYEGEVLLPAARLYSGQTTNFRTPGGGFAPVATL